MGARLLFSSSDSSRSSQGSAQKDSRSEDEAGYKADATDVTGATDADSDDAREGELAESAWLLADKDHPRPRKSLLRESYINYSTNTQAERISY
jgi:hypothetical protein